MGHIMELDHPEVVQTIERVIEKVHAAGQHIGVSIGAYDSDSIAKWLKRGVDMISVGGEIMYVYDCAHETTSNFRRALSLCGGNK